MTREVISINSNETVMETCKKYQEHMVGCLVVMEGDLIVGIVTERDIIEKIILGEKNPKITFVRDIMTPNIKTVYSLSKIEEAVKIMKKNNIKKLPVIYNNILVGIITENDITHATDISSKND